MSIYVLDTDIFSLFMRGNEHVHKHVLRVPVDCLAVTIITIEECLTGWYSQIRKARRDERLLRAYTSLQQTLQFLRDVHVLGIDQDALATYHALRARHRRIAVNDLRIAAIALNHFAVLVTHNRGDSAEIEGLTCEDWSLAPESNQ